MTDLRARLQRTGIQGPFGAQREAPNARQEPPLDGLLPGRWHATPAGRCFVVQTSYPLDTVHGDLALGTLLELDSALWSPFLLGKDLEVDLRQALFLDTETTGLMRGASYAFMVGVGFFSPTGFTVVQFFMPDYGDEGALLDLLTETFEDHCGLVSFNGRSFDWPIMQARYLLTRRQPPKLNGRHLDLLPLARRLWRRTLESCALGSLEQTVLGLERESNDVPGYLIPQLYEDYVRLGRTGPMVDVFYHNRIDVLSMVTLASHIGGLLRATTDQPNEPWCDPLALGRMYERLGDVERAVDWYSQARGHADGALAAEADRYLAFLFRRLGRYDEAMAIWTERLDGQEPYPYIELAKQFEHRLKDYGRAQALVEQALERLATEGFGPYASAGLHAELSYRLERLLRRQGN